MSAESPKVEATEFTNPNLEILFTEDEIKQRITELGKQIADEYRGRELVLVGVLKGSCVFLADLMRAIDLELTIEPHVSVRFVQ